jgi:SWI2/SNF2 ATPase/Protein of unknown function DUF45
VRPRCDGGLRAEPSGTPIDKTERVFGDYIDKYTMRQSIEDGVTLEIVYEGRTHKAEISDTAGMDTAFQDIFSDYNLQERLEVLGYGSRDAYLEAKPTIEAKAKDMVTHYLTHVFPNGYKAQIVATSREAAVRYKGCIDAALTEAIASLEKTNPEQINLDSLRKLKTDVIISGGHNDELHAPQALSEEKVRQAVDAKRQWILAKIRHPQKYQNRQHPPGKEVVNGESAPYLGRDYRIEVSETASGDIEFSQRFIVPPAHLTKRRKVLRDGMSRGRKRKFLPVSNGMRAS